MMDWTEGVEMRLRDQLLTDSVCRQVAPKSPPLFGLIRAGIGLAEKKFYRVIIFPFYLLSRESRKKIPDGWNGLVSGNFIWTWIRLFQNRQVSLFCLSTEEKPGGNRDEEAEILWYAQKNCGTGTNDRPD